MKQNKDEKLFARVTSDEAKLVRDRCQEKDEPVSILLRRLLRLWLNKGDKIFSK